MWWRIVAAVEAIGERAFSDQGKVLSIGQNPQFVVRIFPENSAVLSLHHSMFYRLD